jgi:hypothetical protein
MFGALHQFHRNSQVLGRKAATIHGFATMASTGGYFVAMPPPSGAGCGPATVGQPGALTTKHCGSCTRGVILKESTNSPLG